MKRLLVTAAILSIALGCVLVVRPSSRMNATIVVPSSQPPVDVAAIYTKACARCHGDDGRAQTKKGRQLNATDFTSSKWQRGITDAKAIRIVTNGHEEMPAFKDTLSADEIREVMAYVRRFKRD